MGFRKHQYLDIFYSSCTPSSAIMVWISTFMLMIHNFVCPLSQVIQYLDRPLHLNLRPASRHQIMDDEQLVWFNCCLNDVNKMWKNVNCIPSVIFERILTNPQLKKMINFVVISRLDNRNSSLYGINGYLVSQLQRGQKMPLALCACGGNTTI